MEREGGALQGFVKASRAAKAMLAASEEEWRRLAPMIGTSDPAALQALQQGYRAGIPERWTEAERKAAAELYGILVAVGGEKLVGRARAISPGTFWSTVSY